jgi:hypothetical protein
MPSNYDSFVTKAEIINCLLTFILIQLKYKENYVPVFVSLCPLFGKNVP